MKELATDAVAEVRRSEQRRLEPADAKALKGTRYASLKHPALLRAGVWRRCVARTGALCPGVRTERSTWRRQAAPEDAPEPLDEWAA